MLIIYEHDEKTSIFLDSITNIKEIKSCQADILLKNWSAPYINVIIIPLLPPRLCCPAPKNKSRLMPASDLSSRRHYCTDVQTHPENGIRQLLKPSGVAKGLLCLGELAFNQGYKAVYCGFLIRTVSDYSYRRTADYAEREDLNSLAFWMKKVAGRA